MPAPSANDAAYLEVGDQFYVISFELKGNSVTRRVRSPKGMHHQPDETRELTASQLARFWKAMDAAAVDKWLPKYRATGVFPENEVYDWALSVTRIGKSSRSEGDNAFPGSPDSKTAVPEENDRRFKTIYDSFNVLVPQCPL